LKNECVQKCIRGIKLPGPAVVVVVVVVIVVVVVVVCIGVDAAVEVDAVSETYEYILNVKIIVVVHRR